MRRRSRPTRSSPANASVDVLGAQASGARWIVKRGAGGVTVDGVDHPALPVDVVDPTGAGDALAAGMLIDGPALGLAAAARCCAKLGSMP